MIPIVAEGCRPAGGFGDARNESRSIVGNGQDLSLGMRKARKTVIYVSACNLVTIRIFDVIELPVQTERSQKTIYLLDRVNSIGVPS